MSSERLEILFRLAIVGLLYYFEGIVWDSPPPILKKNIVLFLL